MKVLIAFPFITFSALSRHSLLARIRETGYERFYAVVCKERMWMRFEIDAELGQSFSILDIPYNVVDQTLIARGFFGGAFF
jgi:hypothetical protein